MITTTAALLGLVWKLILVLMILVAVIDVQTMSQERRIRHLRLQGLSQQQIACRLQITRYRVRLALA